MTTLTIEPETFYAAGRRCFTIADELAGAIDKAKQELSATGAMSGSYDSGLKWGHDYDGKARKALETAGKLVSAIHNYGGVLVRSGFKYDLADFDANIDGGTSPVMPNVPTPPTASSKTIPSAAGGHGEGLIDDFLGLVDKIGVPVPDGDTEKLSTAANAWRTLAKIQLPSLSEAAHAFSLVEAPEIEYIDDDLRALTSAIGDMRGTFNGLALACTDYETALEELRTEISDFLEALAVELAISAVIGIAGSFISLGGTAVGAAAKAAHTVLKFAKLIAKKIRDWNKRRRENELETVPDSKDAENTAERLDDLGKDGNGSDQLEEKDRPPAVPTQPTKITGLTAHGKQQALTRDGHGVSDAALEDAVVRPTAQPVRQQNGGWYFEGEDATVVLNDKGEVITTWATNRNGWRTP